MGVGSCNFKMKHCHLYNSSNCFWNDTNFSYKVSLQSRSMMNFIHSSLSPGRENNQMHTAHPITLQKYVIYHTCTTVIADSTSISTIFSPQASTQWEQNKPNLSLKHSCPHLDVIIWQSEASIWWGRSTLHLFTFWKNNLQSFYAMNFNGPFFIHKYKCMLRSILSSRIQSFKFPDQRNACKVLNKQKRFHPFSP